MAHFSLAKYMGYYQLAETTTIFKQVDGWIRRRLRMIRWKEWKKIKTKHKNLTRLGINYFQSWEWANSRLGY